MARPCEFCEDDVLDKVMRTFWAKGYDGTSLEDLLNASGIARQSLYNRFGDKRSLFLKALQRYQDDGKAQLKTLFEQVHPISQAFRQLFETVRDETDSNKRMGCFAINAAMEMAHTDLAIADFITRNQRQFEQLFVSVLEQAKTRQELPADFDALASGRFLVGAYFGLKVLAKSDPSSPMLTDMIEVSLKIFKR